MALPSFIKSIAERETSCLKPKKEHGKGTRVTSGQINVKNVNQEHDDGWIRQEEPIV